MTIIFIVISVLITWLLTKESYEQRLLRVKKVSFTNTIWELINRGFIEKSKGEQIITAYKDYLNSSETPKNHNNTYRSLGNQQNFSKEQYKSKNETKQVLTGEQIKERNISWILSSGVILVLLSGILFATTNWQMLGNMIKAILLTMVSVVFFCVSIVTNKFLKINKTSFAFWILGSLFLPLSFIGYSYFGVFGEYLSIYGQGKFLLGVIGSFVCLPVYIYSAYKYKNRIFSWISLTNITIGIIFLISSFYPTKDVFYFILIMYNAILLILNIKLKKYNNIKIFTDETNLFIQINLILTTAATLYLYDNKFINSINILICAILYMFAIVTINIKDYTYLFNILFVYGIHNLISNSVLQRLDIVLFAMLGIIFIGFASIFKKDNLMKNSFLITSGLVAAAVLGGMAYEISMNNDFNILNLISYIIIAINYLYLGIKSKNILVNAFFPSILLMIALEIYKTLKLYFGFTYIIEFMFAICFILFFILYVINNIKSLQPIKVCSGIIYTILMLLLSIGQLMSNVNISATVMLFLFTIVLYTVYRIIKYFQVYDITRYLIPISLFISLISGYYSFNLTINFAVYFSICSLVIFWLNSLQFVIKNNLSQPYFIIGHILLLISGLDFYLDNTNGLWFFIILLLSYIYSYIIYPKETSKIFLYLGFITLNAIFDNLFSLITKHNISGDLCRYTALSSAIGIIIYYFITHNQNIKKHILYYLTPISALVFLQTAGAGLYGYWALLAFFIMLIYMYYNNKFNYMFKIMPLVLLLINNLMGYHNLFNDIEILFIALMQISILMVIGYREHKYLFNYREVDIYNIFALLNIILLPYLYLQSNMLSDLIKPTLLSGWIFIQIHRQINNNTIRLIKTIFVVSLLWPYYSIILNLDIKEVISVFLYGLPIIITTYIITKYIYNNSVEFQFIEYISQLFVYLFILNNCFYNIEKGIVFGFILILGIIISNWLRWKSLFIGTNVMLLLNVFIQTREFWFNIPWWIYLLVGGLILIITASINEFGKLRYDAIKKIKEKFENWS